MSDVEEGGNKQVDEQPRDELGRFTSRRTTSLARQMLSSDYWWSSAYEIGLSALIIAAGVILAAIGEVSDVDELRRVDWWYGVGVSALVAGVNFIRAKILPATRA